MTNDRFSFGAVTVLFFLWGFITCLNDVLVPHLKDIFQLSYAEALLIQFCFFSAYFVCSLPSGALVRRLSYPSGISLGLAIAGCGALLFYPAAMNHSYPLFLGALFVLASGITLLQVAANPFATALGPVEFGSARLAWVQGFNSLGTTIAPLFGAYLILQGDAGAEREALSYVGIGIFLLLLCVVFKYLPLPHVTDDTLGADSADFVDRGSVWQYPGMRMGLLAIFFYVGAEVGIGSLLVNHTVDVWHIQAVDAGKYVALYWSGAMVGRFVGTYFLNRFSPSRCLMFAAFCALVLVGLAVGAPPALSPYFLLGVGLFNSIMFPVIFSLSIQDLGTYTSRGAALLCMAIVGGAILPFVQGVVADYGNLQWSFMVPLVGYAVVLAFSMKRA